MYDGTPLEPLGGLLAAEFPRPDDSVYLNTAAQGLLPLRAIDALRRFDADRGWPCRVDDDRLLEIETTCRARLAELVGAPAANVGLAVNTSEGLNLAALQLPLETGDRVLVPRGEFPANVHPWLALERRGIETRFLEPTGAHLSAEEVAEALDADPSIRGVALALVQFSNGHRHPVEAVGRACRERGVWLAVDAIQGIGAVPAAWPELSADVLACGGQKWLCAPWGSGFFVVSDALCARSAPRRAGWLQVAGARDDGYAQLCDYRHEFPADATRFEVGTYAYGPLLGLAESVGLLLEAGVERVAAHAGVLLDQLAAGLEARGATLVGCRAPACRSSILCFRLGDSASSRGLHRGLTEAGVRCAYREGSIRLSPHLYNVPHDVERTLDAIDAARPAAARSS